MCKGNKNVAKYFNSAMRVIISGREIKVRGKEHGRATINGKWSHSGLTAHKEECDATIDWENPTVLATLQNKNIRTLNFDLKVREALEIAHHDCGPGKGLNEDMGSYVKTDVWRPVLNRIPT